MKQKNLAFCLGLILITFILSCESSETNDASIFEDGSSNQDARISQDGSMEDNSIVTSECKDKAPLDKCSSGFCAQIPGLSFLTCQPECSCAGDTSSCGQGNSCYFYASGEKWKFLCLPCGYQKIGEGCKEQSDCECGAVCAPQGESSACLKGCCSQSDCTGAGEKCIEALGYPFNICSQE